MPTIKGRAFRARMPAASGSIKPKKLACAVATALAIPAVGLQTARAQEAQQQPLEEVLVTGSRIVRRDFDANSPLTTVDASAFESQSSIAIETALNDLPQFVPAAQGMTQLQDQSQLTDNFTTLTAGASTISLRGLGANRNLVLLDGYRAVPVNATMAVDVNSIPAAAIQRVEVITGGASSVYGADAVAGVVNFILKKDFEGVDVDLQTGAMQNGEGAETRASVLFGVNSADGRGNIMVGIELAKRAPIHADDTDFYHNALRDGDRRRHRADLYRPVLHDQRRQRAARRRHRRDLQSAAGRHRDAQCGRAGCRQRVLERQRDALHGRRDLQRHRPRGHRRHVGHVSLQRADLHVPVRCRYRGRLPVPQGRCRRRDHAASARLRGEHPPRSGLGVRSRRVRGHGRHHRVRADFERAIEDAAHLHRVAGDRRLGHGGAVRQRDVRAVVERATGPRTSRICPAASTA